MVWVLIFFARVRPQKRAFENACDMIMRESSLVAATTVPPGHMQKL
jgi:hypothetical protein